MNGIWHPKRKLAAWKVIEDKLDQTSVRPETTGSSVEMTSNIHHPKSIPLNIQPIDPAQSLSKRLNMEGGWWYLQYKMRIFIDFCLLSRLIYGRRVNLECRLTCNGTPDMKGLADVQNMRMQFGKESQAQSQS